MKILKVIAYAMIFALFFIKLLAFGKSGFEAGLGSLILVDILKATYALINSRDEHGM